MWNSVLRPGASCSTKQHVLEELKDPIGLSDTEMRSIRAISLPQRHGILPIRALSGSGQTFPAQNAFRQQRFAVMNPPTIGH
jgi:hypothetical protein